MTDHSLLWTTPPTQITCVDGTVIDQMEGTITTPAQTTAVADAEQLQLRAQHTVHAAHMLHIVHHMYRIFVEFRVRGLRPVPAAVAGAHWGSIAPHPLWEDLRAELADPSILDQFVAMRAATVWAPGAADPETFGQPLLSVLVRPLPQTQPGTDGPVEASYVVRPFQANHQLWSTVVDVSTAPDIAVFTDMWPILQQDPESVLVQWALTRPDTLAASRRNNTLHRLRQSCHTAFRPWSPESHEAVRQAAEQFIPGCRIRPLVLTRRFHDRRQQRLGSIGEQILLPDIGVNSTATGWAERISTLLGPGMQVMMWRSIYSGGWRMWVGPADAPWEQYWPLLVSINGMMVTLDGASNDPKDFHEVTVVRGGSSVAAVPQGLTNGG